MLRRSNGMAAQQDSGTAQECLDAAAHYKQRAASAIDPAAKATFEDAARCWHELLMPFETNTGKMLCPGCDRGMKLIKALPQLGVLSEIVVFYCERCKHAETIAQRRVALSYFLGSLALPDRRTPIGLQSAARVTIVVCFAVPACLR